MIRDKSFDRENLMCATYVCCHNFGVNVDILFSFFTNDPKYKLSALLNLKQPIARFWKYFLFCVGSIFMYLLSALLIFNPIFVFSISCNNVWVGRWVPTSALTMEAVRSLKTLSVSTRLQGVTWLRPIRPTDVK